MEMGQPWGVTTSSNGNSFVVDTGKGQVHMFSTNKKYLNTLGSEGNAPGELSKPAGVASNYEGLLFVANNFNHCVEVFNEEDGTFIRRIGQGELRHPWDVTVLGGDKLFVADTYHDRIAIFSQDGGELTGTFRSRGQGPGQGPAGLAFSPDGSLYVTINGSQEVQVFTANGRHLQSIVSKDLRSPMGIDINDQGQIFVANYETVVVFDKDGKYLYSLPADGAQGVAVSPAGYLLVTERKAKQVAVFS